MAGNGKVGNLFFGINLDSKEFKKGMRQVKKNMKQFQKDMKNGFADVAKGATVLTGAVAGLTTGAFLLTKSVSELVNAQNILAESLGSTQAEIAGFELAADTMGVSYDMLIDKMREFGGVDEFKKLADDVMNAGDATAQLAKAQEIFGNEGLKLLPILQQGSQGLNDYVTEARKLGLALSPSELNKTLGFWAEYEKAMQRVSGLTRQLGVIFSDSFTDMTKKLGDLIENNLPKILAFVEVSWGAFRTWFENMIMGVEMLIDGFGALTSSVSEEFSAIELIVIGLTHPFETVLYGLAKFAEKIISIISSPFRSFGSLMLKSMQGWLVVLEKVLDATADLFTVLGDDEKALELIGDSDNLAKLRKGFKEFEKDLDSSNITGAFDGLIAPEFQENFLKEINETAKKAKSDLSKSFKGFSEKFSIDTGEGKDKAGDSDTESKISGMATLAVAGSIEAFKLENQTENQILDVNKQQLRELKNMTRQQQLQVAGFTS